MTPELVAHRMYMMGVTLPVKCCVCAQPMATMVDVKFYFQAVVPADPDIWQSISADWVKEWGNMYGGLLWLCRRKQNCWNVLASAYPLNFEKVWHEADGVGIRANLLNGVAQ